MDQHEIDALKAELALKQKELDLILAIDHIRDTAPDPPTMLSSIVNILAEQLATEMCLLALINQESGLVELKALSDRSPHQISLNRELVEKAVHLDKITIWDQTTLKLTDMPPTLQIAAVPIIMGRNERLGALLLSRSETAFTPGDLKLLRTAESMVDSAVIQGYEHYKLRQHVKELEAIYRIDHIRDQHLPFDEMLNVVLYEVCQAIDVEAGFVMLYNRSGNQLDLRATTNHDLFQVTDHHEAIVGLANEALEKAELLYRDDLYEDLRSLMCLPLILQGEIIGVLGVVNHRGRHGFIAEDRRLLAAIGSQIDTAIFESMEQRRLRNVLGRSVDPRIMERLLASSDVTFLQGERMVLSVLYADLRGSTSLAERTAPDLLVGFINDYLGQMTEVILADEGTLDKFVGDEVMALFGAPVTQEDHAIRAVRVALRMQDAHHQVMKSWHGRGIEPAPMGVGIATGELIVGEMGGPQRTDFTVIGKAANLGARICSVAKAGEVLISQKTYDLIQPYVDVSPIHGLEFKGVSRDVIVYRINRLLE